MSLSMKEDVTEDFKKVEDILGRKSVNRFDKNVADTSELYKTLSWAENSQGSNTRYRDVESTAEGKLTKPKFSSGMSKPSK